MFRPQSTRADARARSFVGTTRASFWFPLQSKLGVVIRQNSRCSHIELKGLQVRSLFDFVDEIVGEGVRVRFAINGNLARRLVIGSDAHVCTRQAFKKMLQ